MEIKNNFLSQMAKADLTQALSSATNRLALNFNCVRIGIVEEFYPENLTTKVKIASKRVIGFNPDGSQIVRDYAPIFAKVLYSSPYETHPLKKGDEVVLLFNDRELETWFINGQANLQNHERMHDLTDAIALVGGIRSMPRMIEILLDCLHLFYGNSDIQLKEEEIISNTPDFTLNVEKKIETNSDKTEVNSTSIDVNTKTATTISTVKTELTTPIFNITGNVNIAGELEIDAPSIVAMTTQNLNITGVTNFIGNVNAVGVLTATSAVIGNGATGSFRTDDNKTVTVVKGIITGIS